MNKKYIILDADNKYVNSVLWDGNLATWQPPEGTTAILEDQVDPSVFNTEKYTAEQWLSRCGYNPIQLITLLDLESKLSLAGKSSGLLNAVRQWLNLILTTFATNTEPSASWPQPPHNFDETIRDALSKLT